MENKSNKVAIGYIRRSKKSDDSVVSLQEQEHQITKYCQSHDFCLASVVSHDGISGTKEIGSLRLRMQSRLTQPRFWFFIIWIGSLVIVVACWIM